VRILETVQMVLQDASDHTKALTDTVQLRLENEQTKLVALDKECEEAVAKVADLKMDFQAKEKVTSTAKEACDDAKAELHQLKRKQNEALGLRPGIFAERDLCNAVRDTFQLFRKEDIFAPSQQELKDQKLEELKQRLQAIGAQESLVTAGLLALTKAPAERTIFEAGAAEEVDKVFIKHSAKIEEDVSFNVSEAEDAPVVAAETLYDAMLQNAANKMLVESEARETLEKHQMLLEVARKGAAEQAQTLRRCDEERESLHAKMAELGEVLATVQQLTVCIDIATPPPPQRGTASGLDAEEDGAAAESAEDAAEVLADALENASQYSHASEVQPSSLEASFDVVAEENPTTEDSAKPDVIASDEADQDRAAGAVENGKVSQVVPNDVREEPAEAAEVDVEVARAGA
jgi:hypothetical protein